VYAVLYTVHSMSQGTTTGARGERLSRERILDTALALVARDGLDALSMRRLAQDLDVWPMSLYRYFHDKDELLVALADAAAERIAPPAVSGSWRTQMQELLGQARTIFQSHPGGLRPQDDGPATARVRDTGLAILERAGFAADEAHTAWQALLAYTAGSAAFDSGAGDFEYGLARILDGLQAQLAA
jgi:AcrR family transcriptional regulator